MRRRLPRATRTDTLRPYTTLVRSQKNSGAARASELQLHFATSPPSANSGRPPKFRSHPKNPCLPSRSEEHTSEPVTNAHLVCRLLLEKKNRPFRNLLTPSRTAFMNPHPHSTNSYTPRTHDCSHRTTENPSRPTLTL